MPENKDVTGLLRAWADGDEQALDALTPLVYSELHKLAMRVFSGERAGHTLQPTALVNEVYVKLVNADVSWQDRAHFYALSARQMRRFLVTYAVARKTEKRGGKAIVLTLNESVHSAPDNDIEIERLDDALSRLAEIDAEKADLVELRYFAGLSIKEIEEVTGMSNSTVNRHMRTARAWLRAELSESE